MQDSIKKLYYSITEAAKIVSEEQHVLRYWEREFVQLKPQKNRAGNRVYSQRDMAILMLIRNLLREQRYTVAGAKEYLKTNGVPEDLTFVMPAGVHAEAMAEPADIDVVPAAGVDDERGRAARLEAKRLIEEIRAFSAEIRSKTGQNG
ncbi:MAG: MerR family transcriptional regulator [Candidatus Kapabacteria bacterium]|nr:MerR family transcriptional regulator [Candidatus Kapabacteria bacterium]